MKLNINKKYSDIDLDELVRINKDKILPYLVIIINSKPRVFIPESSVIIDDVEILDSQYFDYDESYGKIHWTSKPLKSLMLDNSQVLGTYNISNNQLNLSIANFSNRIKNVLSKI